MKEYADQAFPTREAFYQSLERSGIKIEDYKKGIARQMTNERLMHAAVGEVVVSEDEAVHFYDTMKELFYHQPESHYREPRAALQEDRSVINLQSIQVKIANFF